MATSRDRIFERIRASLTATGPELSRQAAAFPPPHPHGPFVASDADVVEQFRAELSTLHAQVYLCQGAAAAERQVLELLAGVGARSALCWRSDELPLHALHERLGDAGITCHETRARGAGRGDRFETLEPVPVGISGVDAAIAESGTMLVASGAGRGRLVSLLPPMHIALLPAERIVQTLPDAIALLRERFGAGLFRDRSNLVMITGPSRTADIELSLTLGVHGPRDIHAIVVR